jgi:hypothetical protein
MLFFFIPCYCIEIQLQGAHRRLKHGAGSGLNTSHVKLWLYWHRNGRIEFPHVIVALTHDQSAEVLLLG